MLEGSRSIGRERLQGQDLAVGANKWTSPEVIVAVAERDVWRASRIAAED